MMSYIFKPSENYIEYNEQTLKLINTDSKILKSLLNIYSSRPLSKENNSKEVITIKKLATPNNQSLAYKY